MRIGGTMTMLRNTGKAMLLAATMAGTGAMAQTAADAPAADAPAVAAPAPPARDAGTSVSVFSTAGLEARGIQSTLQLAPYVPNMVGANSPGVASSNSYFIRGIGSTQTLAGFDPAVGTYIDGVSLGRQNANNFSFFDVERIDVLRGPQGVLLGRNATGGAIDVLLRQPSDKLEGYGEFSYGAYSRYTGRGSINLPLNQSIAIKLSGYYQTDKGYVHDSSTGARLNDNDGYGMRLAMRVKFSDNLTWNGAVAYTRSTGANILNFDCDPANPANCNGRYATTGLRASTASYAPLAISGDKAGFGLGNAADNILYTSNFEWAGEHATVNVITGYVDLTQKYGMDYADGRAVPSVADPVPAVRGYPLGGLTMLNDGSHRQFSQELKVSGALFGGALDYVTGFLVTDARDKTDLAGIATSAGVPQLLADRVMETNTTALAGYVQGGIHFSSQLKLTAGVRYTDETRMLRVSDNRAACAGSSAIACLNQASLFAPSGLAIPTRQKAREWAPRVALEYKPSDALMLFASASRGYQSGGWDTRSLTASGLLPFGPETAWSYEAGVRSGWFDQRLSINLTGFLIDAKNVQAATDLLADAATTRTVAGLRNKGVELEVAAVPIDGLRLYANAGFQDANYRVDANAPGVDQYGVKSVAVQQAACLAQLAAGKVPLSPAATNAPDCATGIVTAGGAIARPLRAPRLSLAAGGSYDFKIPAAGIILTPSAHAIYRSSQETDGANATIYSGSVTGAGTTYAANPFGGTVTSGSHASGYVLVNAALTLRTDDNNWTLALECSNCLDRAYVESSVANYSYLGEPRSWQVRLKRVF
jgi:iron complex outermembrane receptor protein